MALKLGALSCRRVPSSNGNGRLMKFFAKTLCGFGNSHQRRAQVAFNVHRERFNRRNVYYAAAPSCSGDWAKHQSIDAPQTCGKRFPVPAGARITVDSLRAIAGHPALCGRVGAANTDSNQSRPAG
jgi:hypothetical protein